MTTMESGLQQRPHRTIRANGHLEGGNSARRGHHANKRWVADGLSGRSSITPSHAGSDTERWERGGHRGGGRRTRGGRGKFSNASVTFRRNGALDGGATGSEGEHSEMEEDPQVDEVDFIEPETPEEREKFWQELVKAREVERKRAIAEGKMDDPLKPKRLEDAITMVGTCVDKCPRFERFRRERENNLFEWETIPGTKRVDHKLAVKAYERAAGDKTLPSDLRPPDVLKNTLDYLFHELLPRGGFSETFNFIRDRSRAVRNDFTMQHEMGPIAIECHDRCARFHILTLHVERDRPGFSIAMEEQQLMNTLQSLKEFYLDQRDHYQSPTELEMRVYHRLIHIRDQKERHDDIPQALLIHPVFELTTKFRARVQTRSAPITKTSPLVVDPEAMQIFAELAGVLRREGNMVMTYLVACILERHFGKDTIENIESIRGDLSFSDIIDGYIGMGSQEQETDIDISVVDETEDQVEPSTHVHDESPRPLQPSGTPRLTNAFGSSAIQSAFSQPDLPSQPSAPPAQSAFSNLRTVPNAFGMASFDVQNSLANVSSSTPPFFGQKGNNNAVLSSSELPGKVTEISATSIGFPTATSVPSHFTFPPGIQPTAFTLPAEQSSQTAAWVLPQPAQVDDVTFGVSPGSEGSLSKSLNPLAPTFIPKPVGPNGLSASTSSASGFTPLNSYLSSAENRRSTVPALVSRKSSGYMPQQQTQGPPAVDMVESEMTFVSSPPSIDFTPPEGGTEQIPPSQPPPLARRRLVSLPSTPTGTVFIPSSLPQSRKSSLRNLQTSTLSAAPTEILSPLVIHSPFSRSSIPSIFSKESTQSPLKPKVGDAGAKAKPGPSVDKPFLSDRLPPAEKPDRAILKATALHFARRGWLVKRAFSKWRQRLDDQAQWIEACRRSVRYKEKVEAERLSRSVGSSPASNGRVRRRTSSETRMSLKKRLRGRLSAEYRPPTNDEELASRFEKNYEEHAHRWARGSFLGILKDFLESTSRPLPDNWSAWLSLNQENDGTAIWLEQKFDVPDSGKWKNDNVFQIPISKNHVKLAHSYPGVVLFERTPLMGVTDILGRKYRVLEDCTRLREIIEAFPTDRYYTPSLLCIAWSERDPDSSKDFDDMVESIVKGKILTSTHELVISTATLDMESKLAELLHAVPFDLEGRLVKRLSLNELFKIWEPEWEETTTRWLGNCNVYGDFDWDLYAKLLEGCSRLMTQIIDLVTSLLRDNGPPSDLTHLQLFKGMNSETTFDAVLDWLGALPRTELTNSLILDIKGHRGLCRDFPTMTFLSQLYALSRSVAAHVASLQPEVTHFVSRSRLDEGSRMIEKLKVVFEEEMKVCHIARLKPSKRLASFTETSPSRTSTPRSKKQRFSDGSPTDEETTFPGSLTSPSPSITTSVPSEPADPTIITSAMLRSLTKDIRAKYGAAPSNALSASISR